MNENMTYRELFLSRVKKNWYKVVASVVSGIIRSTLMLLPPFFIRNVLNKLSTHMDIIYITKSVLITILMPTIVLILFVVDAKISKYLFDIVKDIRYKSMDCILSQKLRWVLLQNKNDLYNKTITSTIQIAEFYYYTLSNLAWYTTTAIIGTLLMLYMSPYISVALLSLSIIQVICTVLRGKVTMKVTEGLNNVKIRGDEDFNNILQFNSFIKVGLLKKQELINYQNLRKMAWENCKDAINNFVVSDSMTFVIVSLKSLTLYGLAYYFYQKNSIKVGDIVALNSYVIYLTPVLYGLQDWVSDAFSARVNKKRVSAFLTVKNDQEKNSAILADYINNVKIDNICFDYASNGQNDTSLLKDISFELEKEEVLYIIGPSGCGKSTLINILTNIEEGYEGKIKYNGVELKKIDDDWIRKNVVCVGQDNEIMNTSLRENLLFSGKEAEDEEILSVLDELQLSYLIKSVPGGLDWDIRKNPRQLSDGEKKRLSIARALLADPQVLILDEPTAGIDNINKMRVVENIRNRIKNRILIIVTHDKIYDNNSKKLILGGKN